MEPKKENARQNIVSAEPAPTPGYIPELEKLNLPKRISKYQQLKAAYAGFSLAVFGVIFGIGAHNIVIGLVIGGFGLLMMLLSLISYRQLRKSEKQPPSFNQFQTSTATTYAAPKDLAVNPAAAPSINENIEKWLGPIERVDKGSISYTVLSKEVDKQAENTLLFTPSQVIVIMLAPADLANVSQGVLGNAASAFINYSDGSGGDKGQEFRLLHSKHWDKLMAPLLQAPLSSILQTHFNYSIPYNSIQSAEIKHHSLLYPSLIFHLNDGKKLGYSVWQKDKVDDIAVYLQQKVRLEE